MTENLHFDSFHIQERDVDVLRGLFEARIMTTDHIAAIHFNGKRESAKKRLQRFKAAGLIRERRRLVNEKSILFLTSKAFAMLRCTGNLADYPSLSMKSFESRANVSELTIQHELAVMDIKAAFHSAIGLNKRCSVAEFSTWPRLYEFKGSKSGRSNLGTLVRPDGFVRLVRENGANDSYFLELDRSTEAQKRLIAQSLRYRHYFYSGGFAARNGAKPDKFKEHPFRVLMVFKSADRRNNTAERLLKVNPPILTQVCLSTLAEVTANPLGPVWIQPRDYREITRNTQFDTDRQIKTFVYRQNSQRDSFIETRIKKQCLLDDQISNAVTVNPNNS